MSVRYPVEYDQKSPPNNDRFSILRLGATYTLAACAVLFYFFLGVALITPDLLFVGNGYLEQSKLVFQGFLRRFAVAPLFTFGTWLIPLSFAPFIPLQATHWPLKIGAILCALTLAGAVAFFPSERYAFVEFVRTAPEMGYMWHDAMLIMICCFIVTPPSDLLLLWGGPMMCVCVGPRVTRLPACIFVVLGVLGFFIVLPTVSRFIDPSTGDFFLEGFTSTSVAANALSYGLILCWIKCYHLIARDCYATFNDNRFVAIVWLVFGTACVLLYVSSAWAFHLAYTSRMRIDNLV